MSMYIEKERERERARINTHQFRLILNPATHEEQLIRARHVNTFGQELRIFIRNS